MEITTLITTSQIKTHPDTKIIDTTIKSIQDKLENSNIIILYDYPINGEMNTDYEIYKQSMLNKYSELRHIVFDEHKHQSQMIRFALDIVHTPLLLFVEHDTPLCEDIPFINMSNIILSEYANVIRLNHEAFILPEHEHLAITPTEIVNNVPLRATIQWSQRPHLASTQYYKDIMSKYFHPDEKMMIEDRMHSVLAVDYDKQRKQGWNRHRLFIYTPEGDQKRSYHLDGRKLKL